MSEQPTAEQRLYAISLWQPWASLWLTDAKLHETRHWPTARRGMIYVHAAKRPIRHSEVTGELLRVCEDEFGGHFWTDLPFGAVIGIVDLVDCVPTHKVKHLLGHSDLFCGDFSEGRYAWRRGPSPTHIGPWPYKGKQGFFHVDDLDDVANKVLGIA